MTGAEIQKVRKKEREKQYNLTPNKCRYCEKSLSYEKRKSKFCNHSCAASFNNKGVVRNGQSRDRKCISCNNSTINPKYCSKKCQWSFQKKETKKEIEKSGKITGKHTGKKYLSETRGHKCEICRNTEWLNKPILLILDHIDGNSDNNKLNNIRLICSNCDATLPTYKAKNKNNGRDTKRRQYRQNRYHEGSCN
jgi:hypothetical protein